MDNLKRLKEFDPSTAVRHDLGDGVSLTEIFTEIRTMHRILLTVLSAEPGDTPHERFNANGLADRFLSLCAQAATLRLQDSAFHQHRQSLLVEFRRMWNEVGPWRGHAFALEHQHLSKMVEDARTLITQAETVVKAADVARGQAETAAQAAKDAAFITAVSKLTEAYDGEAKEFATRSQYWGRVTAFVGGGMAAILATFLAESLLRPSFSVPQALIRATTIGIGYGVFHLALRTHQAYRHLEVVNRHRVTIGRTFEAFKEAQPSAEARNVVAGLTAMHLLSFGKSGLLSKDLSIQSPMSGAEELFRSLVSKPEQK